MGEVPPVPANQTLYIQNINEKLSRRHRLDELKTSLKSLFKPHGEILDIVALSNFYSKGQAFVVYKSTEQAAAALTKLQGHELQGKKLKISFARAKSDAVAKLDGTFRPREKKVRPRPKTGKREPPPDADADAKRARTDGPAHPPPAPGHAPAPAYGAPPQAPPPMHHAHTPAAPAASLAPALPHPILFLEGLPPDITPHNLSDLFRPYPGFKEVRMVPSRPGIAFCEFETAEHSTVALHRLQGMPMGQFKMIISFSKA